MPWFHRAEPTQGHHSPLAAPQAPPSAQDSLFRTLFDNTLEAVVITDDHGRVLEANAEACRLFGRTLEQMRSSSASDLVDATNPRVAQSLVGARAADRF